MYKDKHSSLHMIMYKKQKDAEDCCVTAWAVHTIMYKKQEDAED